MTYCVALRLDAGMIFASDSRTNAGVDHVSTFAKMRVFERKDDRVIVVLSSGNLAITQGVVNLLDRHQHAAEGTPTIWSVDSMYDAATLVGDALRDIQAALSVGAKPMLVKTGKGMRTLQGGELPEGAGERMTDRGIRYRLQRVLLATEIQKRVAASFSCITFTLIGIPLAIRSHRRETSVGVALSFGVVFAYYFLIMVAETYKATPGAFPLATRRGGPALGPARTRRSEQQSCYFMCSSREASDARERRQHRQQG